ncbi:hypothetical protein PIB30_070775 [Stylosanthes scabra]|uniref:Uncharacterized protein n=1 Tax=Stylosanthes scabra TaxID=79078 RepID=A0ABU6QPQ8_9FABA|nr:hypothetical protein [Stylosanthes scabra]
MEGRLKFEEAKPEMKIDDDPFEVNSSFVEPCCFGVNMAGYTSFEFDTSLGNFEENIRQVFPGVGEGLLDFLMQQKLKDRDVSLCPRCNGLEDLLVLDSLGTMISQVIEISEEDVNHVTICISSFDQILNSPPLEYPCYVTNRGNRGRGRDRGFSHRYFWGRVRFHSQNAKSSSTAEASPSENKDKGAKTSALHRVVFRENQGKRKRDCC